MSNLLNSAVTYWIITNQFLLYKIDDAGRLVKKQYNFFEKTPEEMIYTDYDKVSNDLDIVVKKLLDDNPNEKVNLIHVQSWTRVRLTKKKHATAS